MERVRDRLDSWQIGATGPQGATGVTGNTGPQGPTGTIGAMGPPGLPGSGVPQFGCMQGNTIPINIITANTFYIVPFTQNQPSQNVSYSNHQIISNLPGLVRLTASLVVNNNNYLSNATVQIRQNGVSIYESSQYMFESSGIEGGYYGNSFTLDTIVNCGIGDTFALYITSNYDSAFVGQALYLVSASLVLKASGGGIATGGSSAGMNFREAGVALPNNPYTYLNVIGSDGSISDVAGVATLNLTPPPSTGPVARGLTYSLNASKGIYIGNPSGTL